MAGAKSRSSRRRRGVVLGAVRPVIEDLVDLHDVVLWDVEFTSETGRETLRVSVDRRGGIDAQALRDLSEDLSHRLDETDAVPGESRYWLEVTSPGAERKLRTPDQYRLCRGRLVRLTFRNGRHPVIGEIGEVEEDAVVVGAETEEPARVRFADIAQARLQIPGD